MIIYIWLDAAPRRYDEEDIKLAYGRDDIHGGYDFGGFD